MFLCLPLTLQEEPTESWTGHGPSFSLSMYRRFHRMGTIRIEWPHQCFINQMHFILCSFVHFWFLPFYDEHTWSAEGTLETGCDCGSIVSTSGHCSATNIVCMSIYFSSKHSIKKKPKNPQSKWWVFFPSERLSCQARHQKYSWKMLSTEIIY